MRSGFFRICNFLHTHLLWVLRDSLGLSLLFKIRSVMRLAECDKQLVCIALCERIRWNNSRILIIYGINT
jgi:hypothetical protein